MARMHNFHGVFILLFGSDRVLRRRKQRTKAIVNAALSHKPHPAQCWGWWNNEVKECIACKVVCQCATATLRLEPEDNRFFTGC